MPILRMLESVMLISNEKGHFQMAAFHMEIIVISALRRYASEQPPEGRLLASRRRVSMFFYFENYGNDTPAAAGVPP